MSAVVEYGNIYLASYIGFARYKKLQNGASTMMLAPEMLFQPFAGYEKAKSLEEVKRSKGILLQNISGKGSNLCR